MEKALQNLELIVKYFPNLSLLQQQQLSALDALYRDWNDKINIISRKDIDALYEKHVLHSLSIAAITRFSDGSRIIDIGTGGGFPGIPLAILFPHSLFHLTDSIGKKLKVVNDIASALELKNVTTQQTRVEEIKGRRFDYAVSRAVAPLQDLWKWSKLLLTAKDVMEKADVAAFDGKQPLLPGLICLKGGDLTEELATVGGNSNKTMVFDIYPMFREAWFQQKYIVFLSL